MIVLNDSTRKFIEEHENEDVKKLALRFHPEKYKEVDFRQALTQISGRQSVKNKIPDWFIQREILFPAKLSIEQASSQKTAEYKSSLVSGTSFVDLTGGMGIDFSFFSKKFKQSVYVEKDSELSEIAKHNFRILDLKNINVVNADALDYLKSMNPVDWIYLDPARRSSTGKKVVSIGNCEPDVELIQSLIFEKTNSVLLKYSPMLDIIQAFKVLKQVKEVHVVSVENECKELLFILQNGFFEEPPVYCINFPKNTNHIEANSFYISREKTLEIAYANSLGKYLYEPNASILKAGYLKGLAVEYPIRKLHRDSHLYTSDQLVSAFPGRIFEIEKQTTFNKKDLKIFLSDIDSANLTVRNFPLSAEELRKKLKLREGGDIYLFATTLFSNEHALLRTKKQ